jgi:hypothetical protein
MTNPPTPSSPGNADDRLRITYADHERVRQLIDLLVYCAEGISVAFDGWDDRHTRGPGLYFVVVSGNSVREYADPMGDNRWPIAECRTVTDDYERFYDIAADVAFSRDGAVIVSVDGVLMEQMVRLRDLTPDDLAALPDTDHVDYANWMGARHMSAADTSARPDVVSAVTLSEEDGRVTVFHDGTFDDTLRERLGGEWRVGDE